MGEELVIVLCRCLREFQPADLGGSVSVASGLSPARGDRLLALGELQGRHATRIRDGEGGAAVFFTVILRPGQHYGVRAGRSGGRVHREPAFARNYAPVPD